MKKLFIVGITFLLISCASQPKPVDHDEDVATGEGSNVISAAPAPISGKSIEAASSPPVAAVPKEVQKATANLLDEAIRSQSDEKIFKAATQALLQNSADPQALNALALSNYKKGKLATARYLLIKAVQVQPSAELYNNLGVVHSALEENREALQAFRQAFSLNPQDGVIAANLGAIFVDQKNYSKAVVALETAYHKGLRDFRVLNNYAIALTATGKGLQAQGLYERALKDQSNNKDILFNQAILLIEVLKKYKEGSEVLNRLKFVGGSSEQRSRIKDLENKVKIGLQ